MNINERLNKEIEKSEYSYQDLANITGISKSSIQRYATGETKKIPIDSVEKLAAALSVSSKYLMGWSEEVTPTSPALSGIKGIIPLTSSKRVPILGTIACGDPILAEENISGYTEVTGEHHADFALICKGDSMAPTFLDGDTVLIRKQPDVLNGQIAAVLIGDEATLKHVYLKENQLLLTPANSSYDPIILTGEAINTARILGLAIGFTRFFGKVHKI